MMGVQNEESHQLHDVSIRVSGSYMKHKMLCNDCKRRLSKPNDFGYPSILDLPSMVLVNILSRLPIKSIFHSKCVCKVWYKLIIDPYFAKAYLANSPFVCLLLSFSGVLSQLLEVKQECKYVVSRSEPVYSGHEYNLVKGLKKEFKVLGYCNGLVCLLHGSSYDDDHSLCISNPIFRECVRIPRPSSKRVRDFVYGFGCSEANGQFKVLRIAKKKYIRQPLRSETEIFTVGVDESWRDVGACPFPNYSRNIVTFNGALHWIEESGPEENAQIFLFDFVEEKVRALPSPHGLSRMCYKEVGVLGNCLCIFDDDWSPHFDIWWMRDYGVAESWTRERISRSWIGAGHRIRPVTIWRDGEILMASCAGDMFSYDPKQQKSTRVKDSHMRDKRCEAIVYVPNFFSLKDVTGEDVQMINAKSRY